MKKLLIATAALAMVAGAAQAQSSVTVYGIIDTGFNSLDNNDAGTSTKTTAVQTAGEASTSRFGVRGSEDLGGGLRANFVMESTVAANTAMTFGGRAFWAGLQDAKMGELRIGRQDTFVRSVWLGHDQLAAANVAGNLAHDGNGSGAATTSHTNRSEAVNYLSPRMNGFQVSAGVMQNNRETTSTAKTGTGSQFGLNYVAGKLSVAVAQVTATTDTAAVAAKTYTMTAGTSAINVSAADATSVKTKDTGAAVSYDLGFAKVAYIYNKREATNSLSAAAGNSYRESNSFSASVPLSPKLTGRIGYGFGEYGTGATSATRYDLKGMQAALNYDLSKRSTLYAIYGDEKRDLSSTTQYKSKEYSVGVRHSF